MPPLLLYFRFDSVHAPYAAALCAALCAHARVLRAATIDAHALYIAPDFAFAIMHAAMPAPFAAMS